MAKTVFELDFPEGIVRFPFELKAGPRLLHSIVDDLLPLCDILTGTGKNIAASFGRTVSCRAGCDVCCCQLVPVSPPEAAIIADVVEGMPPERKKSVFASFKEASEKLAAAGIRETISHVYSTRTEKDEVMEVNRKYFGLSIPCPFLVNGSCSIYPHRPSRCREYSVVSPAEYCANLFDGRIRRLPLTIKLCESVSLVWSSLSGKPPLIVPLVNSLDWVRDNPGARILRIDEHRVERVVRAILEDACAQANKTAREKIEFL
jgi:Fe-S-cluster containining protein